VASTNTIPLSSVREPGSGGSVHVVFHCTETVTVGAGTPLFMWMIQLSDNVTFSAGVITPASSAQYGNARHYATAFPVADTKAEIVLPSIDPQELRIAQVAVPGEYTPQFLRAVYWNTTGDSLANQFNAGKFRIYVAGEFDSGAMSALHYGSGF
jgi:hypothetical protein